MGVHTAASGQPNELVDVADAGDWCGGCAWVVVVAKDPEDGSEFGGGVAAGLFDGGQGRARVAGIAVDQVCGSGGLDVDDGECVRDDVVQLPGDPQSFLLDPALGLPLPRAFGDDRTEPDARCRTSQEVPQLPRWHDAGGR